MTAADDTFKDHWRAAVTNLRLATEVLQSTADELPLDIAWVSDRELRPGPLDLLRRHVAAFYDYTTALACAQALLKQHDPGGP